MKDSEIQWIGEIPDHWNVNKIKFTSYVKGRIGYHGLRSDEFIEEGPYLITGTDFKDGSIDWNFCYHVSQKRYDQDPFIQIKNDDVLITKDGTIGKLAFIKNIPGPTTLNSHLLVIRPVKNQYIPKYIFWLLKSEQFINYTKLTQQGTTFNALSQEKIENFSYTLPSLDEQKQIVNYLDKKTTEIDNEIEKNQKLIELLKEKRQSTINQAVTKGLDPSVPMKDSGVEWIGKIPEEFKIIKTKFVFSLFQGYAFDGEYFSDRPSTSPILVTPGNFNPKGRLCFTEKNSTYFESDFNPNFLLKKGDLLMVLTDLSYKKLILGRTEFVNDDNLLLNQRIAKINIPERIQNSVEKNFLRYSLNSDVIRNQIISSATGATVFHTSATKVGNSLILLPSITDQNKIIKYLDKKTKDIDSLISKTESEIEKLKEFRQSLITSAVTGKIQVSIT